MIRTVLMWDIDGTLLTTGRAGIFAWEDAAQIVLDKSLDFTTLETAGLTDMEIASVILRDAGHEATHEAAKELTGHYERLLPQALPRKKGAVLKGVIEILERIDARPDVLSMLLTGNTRAGAKAKLEHYGLNRFFSLGAFSGERHGRVEVAKHALDIAREHAGDVGPEHLFVIGDTPHDIACGKAIGAHTIAVATGGYGVSALAPHEPWELLDELPDPEAFMTLVGIEVVVRAEQDE